MRMSGRDDPQLSAQNELVLTDPLTGLGNRRRFMHKIARLIEDRRNDPAPFAVCIVDLDGFKPVNDLFGRVAGDHILLQVALRLRNAVDEGASVARIGGDVFALLYPWVFTERAARAHGEMLLEVISAPYDLGDRTARLSASIGGTLFYNSEDDADALLEKAETALRHAKNNGRATATIYNAAMEEEARRAMRIEQALRRAVAAGEVEPHFQPIVDLRTRETIGFECLARWTDRDIGPVAPSDFIPIAEERGIIGALSQLLLRKATQAAQDWPGHLFLSFNLSPSQLVDPETGLTILSILRETGFDPRRLDVEITETGVMTNPAAARTVIADLRRAGIRIALDDFGTGQSSLGRLREFQFDKLKIDRAFISEILHDRPCRHIVKAILAMCDGLGMDAIAEGVEEEAQAQVLLEFGCTGAQGYFFGRPRDARSTLVCIGDAMPDDEMRGALLRSSTPGRG